MINNINKMLFGQNLNDVLLLSLVFCFYKNNIKQHPMRVTSTRTQDLSKNYHIKQQLPSQFLVNWLFIIQKEYINSQQIIKQIENIYEKLYPLNKQGTMIMVPLGHCYLDFEDKMKIINKQKSSKGVIKLVADPVSALNILQNLQSLDRLKEIDQVYIFCPKTIDLSLSMLAKYKSIIKGIKNDIREYIKHACQQISIWRQKFEILRNVLPLNGPSFQQKALSYRVKLFACIKLKPEKFTSSLQHFEDYILKQLDSTIKRDYLKDNLIKAIQYLSINNHDQFMKIMFMLYKDKKQAYFYQIINNGIKKFHQKQFPWQSLALPICLMYKAIKMWFKDPKNRQKIDQMYDEKGQFIVYRGGRISQQQLDEMKGHLKDNSYCQFLSFISASTKLKVALEFLGRSQKQKSKYNCLFKLIIKKPQYHLPQDYLQFFQHGFCPVEDFQNMQQQQLLTNGLNVGKIVQIEEKNLKKLFRENKMTIRSSDQYSKLPIISYEIGSFQDLFSTSDKQRYSNNLRTHKSLISHYLHVNSIIKNCDAFDFGNAYQLCNEMQKSELYLLNEISSIIAREKEMIQNSSEIMHHNTKIKMIYQQQNYYSRLSDIYHKMGRLSQAETYNNLAINKYMQLERIDQNLSYALYQEKLNKFYLKSSQLLIEQHKYYQANQKIIERIKQMQSVEDAMERQRNKVVIARLLLDLGVVNFKQGQLKKAQQTFGDSSHKIEEIFIFIDYDYLKKETFYVDLIFDLLFNPQVKLQSGVVNNYFQDKRSKNIEQITKRYGGQERLLQLKKDSQQLEHEVVEVICDHRQYFCSKNQYEKIIQEVQSKIQNKIKNSEKSAQAIRNKEGKISQEQQTYLIKIYQEKQTINEYENIRHQLNKAIIQQKQNLDDIIQQQAFIKQQKERSLQFRLKFWDNPLVYMKSDKQFNTELDQLILKKNEINREKLLHSNSITMDELTKYYRNCASSINSHIDQLQNLGYSSSAPKILHEYNNLIDLYLKIDCRQKAEQTIQQVKRYVDVKGEQKYYQLAVAFFLKGKIQYSATQVQFLIVYNGVGQRVNQLQVFQKKKLEAALVQLDKAYQFMKKALCKNQSQENSTVFAAEPKRLEILMWKAKCLLKRYQLSKEQQKANLFETISSLLASIFCGLDKINGMQKFQIQANYYEIIATFQFIQKRYNQSYQSFNKCIKLREEKYGQINWQNLLTYIKIIYCFASVDSIKQRLNSYIQLLQKSYIRYKNFPFFWKISLCYYYVNRDCQKHQLQKIANYIEQALLSMEQIGFADQNFYLQYDLLYELQYSQFFSQNKSYLVGRYKLKKKGRKLESSNKQMEQKGQKSIYIRRTRNNFSKIIKKDNFLQMKLQQSFYFDDNDLLENSTKPKKQQLLKNHKKIDKTINLRRLESRQKINESPFNSIDEEYLPKIESKQYKSKSKFTQSTEITRKYNNSYLSNHSYKYDKVESSNKVNSQHYKKQNSGMIAARQRISASLPKYKIYQ